MIGLSAAHGDDPGPTQRPLLAGAISGVLATIPAIAILYAFGSLAVEARILGLSELLDDCGRAAGHGSRRRRLQPGFRARGQ